MTKRTEAEVVSAAPFRLSVAGVDLEAEPMDFDEGSMWIERYWDFVESVRPIQESLASCETDSERSSWMMKLQSPARAGRALIVDFFRCDEATAKQLGQALGRCALVAPVLIINAVESCAQMMTAESFDLPLAEAEDAGEETASA